MRPFPVGFVHRVVLSLHHFDVLLKHAIGRDARNSSSSHHRDSVLLFMCLLDLCGILLLQKLPFTIPELVQASPCRSTDGLLYTGKDPFLSPLLFSLGLHSLRRSHPNV